MIVKPWLSMLIAFLCIFFPDLSHAAFVPPYTIQNFAYDFDVNGDSSFTRVHERLVRIDTPQGIDQYGQAKVYYDGKRNTVQIVEAYTLRPNGEKVPVAPERIRRMSANTDDVAPYFSDQMVVVIIFPQVEVGSQLYYKAVMEDHDPVIKDRFGAMIAFTPHRAYENATIRLRHPANLPIQAFGRGVEGTKSVLPDGRIEYVYEYRQPDAYPLEPGQIEYDDFSPVIQFSNYQGYEDLARITQDLFQSKTIPTDRVRKLAEELTHGAKTHRQKAEMLYNWVSANIRYVGIDVGASGYEPHSADEILEHGYGDCKDHAVILEALLIAVGIPSSPVLINTSESYLLPQLAAKYYFNHVITYIPEFDLYLDSTAQFTEFGTLPTSDMGKPTLITLAGKIGATPNSMPEHDFTVTHTKLRLMPDGSVAGESKYEPHGYYITTSRSNQFDNQNKDTQAVVDSILGRFQETGTGELHYPDPTDLSANWVVTSTFKLDPVINMPGPSAFSIPTGLAPGYIRAAANVKPYAGRKYPFSCGSNRNIEHYEIVIPRGIKVTRIPRGMTVSTKDQTYTSDYKLIDNKLLATRVMTTNVHSDVCKPSEARTRDLVRMKKLINSDLRSQIFVE